MAYLGDDSLAGDYELSVNVEASPLDVELPLDTKDYTSAIQEGVDSTSVSAFDSGPSWWDSLWSWAKPVVTTVINQEPQPGDPNFVGPVQPGSGVHYPGSSGTSGFGGAGTGAMIGLGLLGLFLMMNASSGRRK